MAKSKIIKLTMADDCYAIKCNPSAVELMESNSNRFSEVLAGRVVLASIYDNYRVKSENNPHIARQLKASGVNNYRIDGLNNGRLFSITASLERGRTYRVNTETGDAREVIPAGAVRCPECGRITQKTELKAGVCEDCFFDEWAKRFGYHDYCGGYKIADRSINESKTPVFGCEIEQDWRRSSKSRGFSSDYEQASRNAVNILYADEIAKNKPVRERRAVFMSDGSLENGGVEWITFPASYKNYKTRRDEFQKVFDAWSSNGFVGGYNAGLHIHINRKFFTAGGRDASRFYGAKMALVIASLWDDWHAISGRSCATSYAKKPNLASDDDIFSLACKYMQTEHDHGVALNSQHPHTFEVRFWGAVGGADALLFAIDWTQALAKFCKRASLERCQKAKFIDIARHLTDAEHLAEAVRRLKTKNRTETADQLEGLLNSKQDNNGEGV